MLPGTNTKKDFALHALRRKDLLNLIKEAHPQVKNGCILLCAGFEQERSVFRQESSFYYFTGLTEPGIILLIDLQGKTTIYAPECGVNRTAWMTSTIQLIQENAKALHVDTIVPLGEKLCGFQLHPFSSIATYASLIKDLAQRYEQGETLFTLHPSSPHEYVEQRWLLQRLTSSMPKLLESAVDISPMVASMRRRKDVSEIEAIHRAIEITIVAHEAAAHTLEANVQEAEIQASLEYMMIASNARPAFPSIVGSGKNSTVLHYHANNARAQAGDVVVVDIGAEYDYYCADITRTYPVSGVFTKRQREIYNIVLDTQEYVANIAKPGMWLSNKNEPARSLHHQAQEFLRKRGYDKYFIHGIGHFLGLDVHDVGNLAEPLEEGDVFTIEPGIYIPEEKIGVRIEDNYWVVNDGVVCLSDALPKKADDIEALVQSQDDGMNDDQDIENEDDTQH